MYKKPLFKVTSLLSLAHNKINLSELLLFIILPILS